MFRIVESPAYLINFVIQPSNFHPSGISCFCSWRFFELKFRARSSYFPRNLWIIGYVNLLCCLLLNVNSFLQANAISSLTFVYSNLWIIGQVLSLYLDLGCILSWAFIWTLGFVLGLYTCAHRIREIGLIVLIQLDY